jgi:hypothetical protein
MSNPFEILGVSPGTSEEAIRAAYLQKVREFPPDRAPEKFAEVRAAFDELRDPGRLREKRLMSLDTPDSFVALAADIRARTVRPDLPTDALLLLAEGP